MGANFDVTSTDWGDIVDQSSFEAFLTSVGATSIIISNFTLVAGRLRCNLECDLVELNLKYRNITQVLTCNIVGLQNLFLTNNQIVTFNPTIALPASLQYLGLSSNQIVTFNPTIALPTGLQYLGLDNNVMTINGYEQSEEWANMQPAFLDDCQVTLYNNSNSANNTNFKSILILKNCTIF